jgi:hypothetical protein
LFQNDSLQAKLLKVGKGGSSAPGCSHDHSTECLLLAFAEPPGVF